ncbi:PREDICTED: uncharacterized protein LOC106804677 [Priapulus caudatus]|uniref:Uncharacterized protein LOC106804677 n=1 Tax=Priapulus caudatus TaxID=37621 RepID=A0ABM1DNB8_PRICU|nr:PREDICTED: uncharacterized protein LOC106804677 [Priapulus caudatus]
MNVRLFLCVTIVSGVIGSNGYAAAATADAYATKAPEYFTTRTYGPVHDGQLSGRGHKTTRVNVDLYGQALGKLFSRDDAERSDSSTKVIGYHLKHTYVVPCS